MRYELWIPGRPRTKGRPKFGKGRTYTPKATVAAEKAIADAYDGPVWNGPVSVTVDFYPEGQRIVIEDMVSTSTLTGDVDNYAKTCLDGLQKGGAFNDRQVMSLSATKHPKGSPR